MSEIKTQREKKGLTQDHMAQILGISRAFYGMIEAGNRKPTYGLACKIADFFGMKAENLFFNIDGFRLKRRKEA